MPPSWMLGQWRIGDWQRIGAEVGCLLLQEIFLCPNPLKIPNSRWQQMYPHTSTIYLYYRLQAAVQERSWRQQTEWAAEISLKNGNKCLLLLLLLLQVHLKRYLWQVHKYSGQFRLPWRQPYTAITKTKKKRLFLSMYYTFWMLYQAKTERKHSGLC